MSGEDARYQRCRNMNLNDLWNSKLTWTVALVFICLWVPYLYSSKKKKNQLNHTTFGYKGFKEKTEIAW